MASFREHELQRSIHKYLKLAVPQPRCIWAVDHARKATMLQRVRLKERGCVSGIHDHFVLYDGTLITLEIKVGKNDPTDGQDIFASTAMAAGARCFVVYSIEDVEAALRTCGVPVAASAQVRDQKLAEWQSRPKKKSKPRADRSIVTRAKIRAHIRATDSNAAFWKSWEPS